MIPQPVLCRLQGIPADEVQGVVRDVLAAPEYQPLQDPIGDGARAFFEWFFSLFDELGWSPSGDALTSGLELIWTLTLVLGAVFLLWQIALRVKSAGRPLPEDEGLIAEGVLERVTELRGQARAAQAAGEFTLALRLYFFALVIGLGERGGLEYNPAWTNRELLERGAPREDVVEALRPLVGQLDAHSFGELPTRPEQVEQFAEVCERLLGAGVA